LIKHKDPALNLPAETDFRAQRPDREGATYHRIRVGAVVDLPSSFAAPSQLYDTGTFSV
jgi:hypothetical protein